MKKEKQFLLEEMRIQIRESGSFIVAQYQNLTGERAYEFRREMAKLGGYFEVVHKRMFLEAVRCIGIEFEPEQLPGHIGLVLGAEDPMEVTKVVMKFSQANKDSFQLLGGFVEGKKASRDDVQRLVVLPRKEQMRSELLGLLCAPFSSVLGVMEVIMIDVISCLDSKVRESKGI